MVDLVKCDHPLCDEGTATLCEGIDAKGRPYRERQEPCVRCSGRGYKLPAPGFYIVHVHGDARVRAARVAGDSVEFTGVEWDLSTEPAIKVDWLRKVAELDGSKPK